MKSNTKRQLWIKLMLWEKISTLNEMIFIGDRGMITKSRRDDLKKNEYKTVKYISALKRKEFIDFLEDAENPLQSTLFDRKNLVEVEHEGVRYVYLFNPEKGV